jgi:hypothetical protein
MLLAVETLAGLGSNCPGVLPLSHLYASYSKIFRTLREIRNPEEIARLGRTIEADISALLGSVDASGNEELKAMSEICNLRKIWTEQSDRLEPERGGEPALITPVVDCLHCTSRQARNLRLKKDG